MRSIVFIDPQIFRPDFLLIDPMFAGADDIVVNNETVILQGIRLLQDLSKLKENDVKIYFTNGDTDSQRMFEIFAKSCGEHGFQCPIEHPEANSNVDLSLRSFGQLEFKPYLLFSTENSQIKSEVWKAKNNFTVIEVDQSLEKEQDNPYLKVKRMSLSMATEKIPQDILEKSQKEQKEWLQKLRESEEKLKLLPHPRAESPNSRFLSATFSFAASPVILFKEIVAHRSQAASWQAKHQVRPVF
ncbi:MAG: hypothetical protein WCW01_01990 [Gammaproteobacteria bacterium]